EATGHLGGRAAFDRKDGFLVDYGIHANRFASEGAATAALREIGHEIDFAEMGDIQFYRDGTFVPLPAGVPELLKARFISWPDKLVIVADMIKLVLANPQKKANVSLETAAWGMGRKEVSSIFKLLSGIGLVSPNTSTASAGDFAIFLKKGLRSKEGAAYPHGGTSQIIEALSNKIEQSGKISLNSRVKSFEVAGGRITSVNVREESLPCKAVVFAVPLQKLGELAGDFLPANFIEKCDSIVPTAGISFDLCLTEKVTDIDGLVVTAEPFVTMGQFTSNIDPSTAPEGKQLATFYYPLPLEVMDDHDEVDVEEKRFRELIEKMFPGTWDKVEWERALRLKMVDGFEPRVGQTAKDRPGVRAPGVDNLFLAGDTVSAPGSGGDVAFGSGVEAAHKVLSFLR
ncbi:MAG: NAD(P)/FAD-dependent oxidoreductase, partial [Actinobacteria bacterium]|nr:NAD(P)/FAD-dependent oxidoreductase [Actinomycetota bacterium]